MKVLIACEFSGIVRDAFRTKGHDAWSCDRLPTERDGPHVIGDAIEVAYCGDWDLMIAHPPCTYLANSGAKHLYIDMKKENGPNGERWVAMDQAAVFYATLLAAPIKRKAVENPVMHGPGRKAIERIWTMLTGGPLPPVHYIQPHQHGHGETKATGFRLISLEPLVPSNPVDGREQRVFLMPPSADRWKDRSRTLPGVAAAMAEQWG